MGTEEKDLSDTPKDICRKTMPRQRPGNKPPSFQTKANIRQQDSLSSSCSTTSPNCS